MSPANLWAEALSGRAAIALMLRRNRLSETLAHPGTVNIFEIRIDRSDAAPGVIGAIYSAFVNSGAAMCIVTGSAPSGIWPVSIC